MIFFVSLMVMLSMAVMLSRLLRGPQMYDRVLAANSFGTKSVLFLCLFSFLIRRPDGIDIALLYALMNFIGTIAVLKFFRYGSLDVALSKMDLQRSASGDDI